MTREQAKNTLLAHQAFSEGKTVQNHRDGWWKDDDNPDFNHGEWRVKPEPREFWIAFGKDRKPVIFEDGDPMMYKGPLVDFVRVREVIE